MAGHSKWANIKHRKGAQDAKRGRIFTKLVREITVAARSNPDVTTNPNLKIAISKAKAANMPNDNIDRAIKKGSGDLDGESFMELVYEGYGNNGVAILITCLTDNKNRTSAELKSTLKKMGGNLGEPGCVAYMFERKGLAVVESEGTDEEAVMEAAMEAGADDFQTEEGVFVITSDPSDFPSVVDALENAGLSIAESGIKYIPNIEVDLEDVDAARNILNLVDKLEDLDDVQEVYANYQVSDEIAEQVEA